MSDASHLKKVRQVGDILADAIDKVACLVTYDSFSYKCTTNKASFLTNSHYSRLKSMLLLL